MRDDSTAEEAAGGIPEDARPDTATLEGQPSGTYAVCRAMAGLDDAEGDCTTVWRLIGPETRNDSRMQEALSLLSRCYLALDRIGAYDTTVDSWMLDDIREVLGCTPTADILATAEELGLVLDEGYRRVSRGPRVSSRLSEAVAALPDEWYSYDTGWECNVCHGNGPNYDTEPGTGPDGYDHKNWCPVPAIESARKETGPVS